MKKSTGLKLISFFYALAMLHSYGRSIEEKGVPPYGSLCNEIQAKVIHTLREQHDLRCGGSGGGASRDVRWWNLLFDYHQELEMDAGRKLILSAINIFLSEINKTTKIRPYLHNYPAIVKNICVIICVNPPDGPSIGSLTSVTANSKGKLHYRFWQGNNVPETKVEETYKEALRLAQQDTGGGNSFLTKL